MIKKILLSSLFSASLFLTSCSKEENATPAATTETAAKTDVADTAAKAGADDSLKTYEVACGRCVYKLDGVTGCPGYVNVDGKKLALAGEKVDAHALGLCAHAQKAKIDGEVKDDTFVVKKFVAIDDGHNHGHGHKH